MKNLKKEKLVLEIMSLQVDLRMKAQNMDLLMKMKTDQLLDLKKNLEPKKIKLGS